MQWLQQAKASRGNRGSKNKNKKKNKCNRGLLSFMSFISPFLCAIWWCARQSDTCVRFKLFIITECTVVPFKYLTPLIWCISTFRLVLQIIQFASEILAVLLISQFKAARGWLMSLCVGESVKTFQRVGLKFLAKGATSGLGMVRKAV